MLCTYSYALGKARGLQRKSWHRRNRTDVFINLKDNYDEEKLFFVNLRSEARSNGYLL